MALVVVRLVPGPVSKLVNVTVGPYEGVCVLEVVETNPDSVIET